MDTKTYAIVDLETTGNSSRKGDRIIQIAIVLMKDREIVKRYMKFVNPGHKIPPFIRELTNIYDQDVADAPSFQEIAHEVRELLEGTVFVAHNTGFDLPFLQSEFERCQVPLWSGRQIDTVELAKIVYPSLPSYRLQDISDALDIPLPTAHRADDDAAATCELLRQCFSKLHTLPVETLQLLHQKSFNLKSDLASLFFTVLKKVRHAPPVIQYETFRGVPYRPIEKIEQKSSNDISYPSTRCEKTTALKRIFPIFEERPAQFACMDLIKETLSTKEEVAIEAPTGIGKTIAYLLPAAIHALETKRPVVISTYTNYLVDKIVTSERIKVSKLLDFPLEAVVLKGRSHYISLKKFEELMILSEQSYDETLTIMQILVWLTETQTGDVNELTVTGGGQLFIDRIRSRKHPHHEDEREADYFLAHVDNAKNAHFIVTNHAMLLADRERGTAFFKHASGLVVDEAHQFVHTADQFLETVFSYTEWKYIAGQLSANGPTDLYTSIMALLEKKGQGLAIADEMMDASERFTLAFDEATNYLAYDSVAARHQEQNRTTIPLEKFAIEPEMFSKVVHRLSIYLERLQSVEKTLWSLQENMVKQEQALVEEWSYWINELTIKSAEWIELFLEEQDAYTVWIERDPRSLPSSLVAVKYPLQSATTIRQMAKSFLENGAGIVWTSGTLSIGENKRYIADQLGLHKDVPVHLFQAPDEFYAGATMYVIDDMPDIQEVSQSEYIVEVANAVTQATMATGGRLFVLFTSKDMLRKTYDLIIESEQLAEYALFAQGISGGSRMKLLKSFQQFNQSVLFGTSSFWEGVDVPGDALSAIIVVRLPFSSPENPVFKAKAKELTVSGKNSFEQYALPEAMMRMRQGFGRLIRASNDQGAFIVLDRRIETKSYGKKFLSALPAIQYKNVSLEQMVKELETCYNRK